MLRYKFFITTRPAIPDHPDSPESRRPAAATPSPPFPEGIDFVRVGQGWRTVYVNPQPFEEQRAAFAERDTYPGDNRQWMVAWGANWRNAGRNASRRELQWRMRFGNPSPRYPRRPYRDRSADELAVIRESVRGRARTGELAPTSPDGALVVARSVPHPWYRCQSLAMVAEHTTDPARRDAILRESLASAWEQSKPNCVVTVAEWPLRVMFDAGVDPAWLQSELERLLQLIRTEPHPFRRADGLHCLAYGTPEVRRAILVEAAESCLLCHGWRRDRRLRWLVRRINDLDHDEAIRIARGIEDGRLRRQALRRIGANEIA